MFLRVFLYFLMYLVTCEALTMKQMKNSGRMMRKTCQPKNEVEDEKINVINDGIFLDETNVKCYMACIMKMANTVRNGRISYEHLYKQADMLMPEEVKEETKAAIVDCKDAANGYKDICDASFYMTKCIYNSNPDVFYFP